MMNRVLFLMLLVLFVMPSTTINAQFDADGNLITIPADQSDPIVYTLDNGLTVVLYADDSQPQVTGMVVVKAGGKNDPPDATGLAHYMEHMLFKGTTELGTTNWAAESIHIQRIINLYDSLAIADNNAERRRIQKLINEESVLANQYAIPNELDRILREMGSTNINAGTGPDYTVYFNNFPSHEIHRWLKVYSHRFTEPVFRSFQAELEVVYEEKNMYSDMFIWNLLEEFNRNFFKNHPYGQQSLIGSVEHLKNPSLRKMMEFYNTWYVPNNMALILTGDFTPEDVMPAIQEYFSRWEPRPLPERTVWEEKPLDGRELVEVKMSPIRIGVLGYRFPKQNHPDRLALEVAAAILSNSNQTGFLDRLGLENELMQATAMNLHYSDHGAGMVLFLPKIIGQSLEKAEELVIEQIERLKRGEFSDTLFDAIRLNLYRDKVMALESSSNLAYSFMESFVNQGEYADVWLEPSRVRALTREDVIEVARRYYTDNFLAFHSNRGVYRPERLEKPGYEPVAKEGELETSPFYDRFSIMPQEEPEYRFVDFERDVSIFRYDLGTSVYSVHNPHNDIFTLTIRFGVGEGEMPMLKYASQMMNLSGTRDLTHEEFTLRMALLGCNYSISSNDSYLSIHMTGLEENFIEALELLGMLMVHPELDQRKLSVLHSAERANRRLERSEPDAVADALREYVLYGENSRYLNRLTMREIRRLDTDTLTAVFLSALQYMPEIHYVGRMQAEEIYGLFSHLISMTETPLPSLAPYYREPRVFEDNAVYITHKRRALQSKIFFQAALEDFTPYNSALYRAFNTYFGGGFSGIVIQEVREFRSLAYATGATLTTPPTPERPVHFSGYIGTQSDKTNEAVDLFMSLVREMPQKPDRMDMIKRHIAASTATQRPGFRHLSRSLVSWEQRGFTRDPAAVTLEGLDRITADDLFAYQKENLALSPFAIIIAGNARQFDRRALANHGEVTRIRLRNLYSR